MSEQNPFAVSQHASGGHSAGGDPNLDPSLSQLIQLLTETRPWVRLVGILMLIGASLMLIGGAFILLAAAMGGGAAQVSIMGAIYLPFAFLYIYPAMCLMKYASAISDASATGQMVHVNEAILQQKKFWRFIGILISIVLGIYVLIIAAAVLMSVF
ncbi:MAG: hypothetical protein GY758_31265 [Fuerstiella sp.]|nr:hypothetical protein [Fuerstiella sp.]MCP4505917.1 hypothetical protein [Fuerstiella sp.]